MAALPALAFGQQPSSAQPPPAKQTVKCADFKHNEDGSWSPVAPVTINGVMMSPDVSFRAGAQMGGVDIGAMLDKKCLPKHQ
jgi:hypothetical protein